jgi:CDK-activating kinase assembly factor MAT1
MDSEDSCPVCGNKRYLNPQMKVLVSPCYHRMCDACVERIFSLGSAPCPVCSTVLRRANFVIQTFEDLVVEKECRIRKLVCRYMNKVESDFSNLKEYDDYLELVEEFVFNLLNEKNVQQVYSQLEKFRESNRDLIEKNTLRQIVESQMINQQVASNTERKRKLYEDDLGFLEEKIRKRNHERISIVNEIASSDQPASLLLAKKKMALESSKPKVSNKDNVFDNHSLIKTEKNTSSSIPVITLIEYFDPVIEEWKASGDLIGGNVKPTLFHNRAIQSIHFGINVLI